jgi:hypothetical protein
MSWLVRIVRYGIAFGVAFLVAYGLAATFYAQTIIGELQALGVEVSLADRLRHSVDDVIGMTDSAFGWMGSYASVMLIALLVAFPVALLVKAVLKPLAPIAYPVAGAAAVGLVVYLIYKTQGPGAVAAIREPVGIALQMLAGLVGGIVFSLLRPVSKPIEAAR